MGVGCAYPIRMASSFSKSRQQPAGVAEIRESRNSTPQERDCSFGHPKLSAAVNPVNPVNHRPLWAARGVVAPGPVAAVDLKACGLGLVSRGRAAIQTI
jgi:hypothetical protein